MDGVTRNMPSPSRLSSCCDTVMPVILLRHLTLSVLFLLLTSVSFCLGKVNGRDLLYHNQFAVHIPNASLVLVDQLAEKNGFRNLGQIGSLEGYFLFQHDRIHKRSADPSGHHHEKLINEPGVVWVEQQYERKRVKRDFASNPSGFFALGRGTEFPDPFYRDQWYLHGGGLEGFDMNVIPAWAKGYSGKGVVVSILDDGIQTNHPDLAQNYDPLASTDINDNDDDPMPRDNGDNKHGTRCAGEVAAAAFNSYCGVGVAFNASIGGVRMLDGTVNDAVEARALSLNPDHIHIYSASWGPEDDGKTVDGPGPLAKRAFINGIMKGRNGKGSIFVWASGNGGRHEDSCNCDGYTNSIFTLSISSATQGGFKPWYLEECSSTLATTYSSGRPDVDRSIATVDMDGALRPEFLCTSEHTGTSASAPIAAGICALALEANPNLTWRDMQHLVVFTSRPGPLHDNSWVVNGIGKKVSHKYGYGLMDAGAMVTLAEQWTNVPAQHVCQTPADTSDRPIPNGFGQKLEVMVETDACAGSAHEIRFLEHVQCRISLRFAPRGNLRIRLTSPSGTQSVLLFERPRDALDSSFDDWPFMSVHFWGERAAGRWKLEILNAGNKRANKAGILKKWQLVFYGTDTNPVRLRSPQTARPSFSGTVATIGRDVHGQTFPSPVSTPFAPSFSNIGRDPTVSVPVPPSPTTGFVRPAPFPGNSGFRPSFPLNSGFSVPDFMQFAGSQAVTVTAPLDPAAATPTTHSLLNCPKFQLNGSCVDSCPSTGYYATADLQCMACHLSCTNCTGTDAYHCINCAAGFYRMMDKNLCVDHCPDSYHTDVERQVCIPCQPQCGECDRALECKACESRLVLFGGQCLASCPAGSYETDDYTCAPCDPACATCRGPEADHCVSCHYPTHSEFNGTCVQQCPSGFWSRDEIVGTGSSSTVNRVRQCLPCPPGCADCSLRKDGFGLACTRCADATQWLLDASSQLCLSPSVNHCPEGEYLVGEKCFPCHGSCAQCSGPSSSQCISCAQNGTMYGGSCLASTDAGSDACPQGTFVEAGSDADRRPIQYCRPCPLACARCDGLDRCTECLGSLHLQDGQCLAACLDGYYSDRGVCHRCHGSCAACSGPLADSCTSCSVGFSLFQKRCLSQCPLGHYNISAASLLRDEDITPAKATLHFCGRCHPACQTCTGPDQADCQICAEGFILVAGSNNSCLPLAEESGPLVQFVKESEGREARAKDNPAEGIPRDSNFSHWIVGIGASVAAALVVVVAIQVRSRLAARYSRITQVGQNERRRISRYNSETGGAETMLLSSCDLDDDFLETDNIAIPKV